MEENYCSTGLCSRIVCSAVCVDDAGPECLLAPPQPPSGPGTVWGSHSPMICSGFVRPPVDLFLELGAAVSLRAVSLQLRWHQQLTTGVVLWTSHRPLPPSSVAPTSSRACGWKQLGWRRVAVFSAAAAAARGAEECGPRWHGRLVFATPAYLQQHPHLSSTRETLCGGAALRDVRAVRVTLSHVLAGSAVCVQRLMVWALPPTAPPHPPSRPHRATCSHRHTPHLQQQQCGSGACSDVVSGTSCCSDGRPVTTTTTASAVIADDRSDRNLCTPIVPSSAQNCYESCPPPPPSASAAPPADDMLDAITCRLMTVPMVLPSGHTVDRTTLERCAALDCTHGRAPRDPFTGVPFSSVCAPVPAPLALKARIDHYLFENAARQPEVAQLGRVLGGGGGASTTCHDARAVVSCLATGPCAGGSPGQQNSLPSRDHFVSEQSIPSGDESNSSSSQTLSGCSASESKSVSVEEMIRSTLSGLATFRRDKQPSGNPNRCACRNQQQQQQPLYRLPLCGHVICRNCLTVGVRRCHVCREQFSRRSVCRAHTVP